MNDRTSKHLEFISSCHVIKFRTYRELEVHSHRRSDRQNSRRISHSQIRQPRPSTPLQCLNSRITQPLDTKEHAQRHRQLHERHHHHTEHIHTHLLVQRLLLQHRTLNCHGVSSGTVELFTQGEDFCLVGSHTSGISELDDAEGEEDSASEESCGEDGWAPRKTAGEVEKLHSPTRETCWCP